MENPVFEKIKLEYENAIKNLQTDDKREVVKRLIGYFQHQSEVIDGLPGRLQKQFRAELKMQTEARAAKLEKVAEAMKQVGNTK